MPGEAESGLGFWTGIPSNSAMYSSSEGQPGNGSLSSSTFSPGLTRHASSAVRNLDRSPPAPTKYSSCRRSPTVGFVEQMRFSCGRTAKGPSDPSAVRNEPSKRRMTSVNPGTLVAGSCPALPRERSRRAGGGNDETGHGLTWHDSWPPPQLISHTASRMARCRDGVEDQGAELP